MTNYQYDDRIENAIAYVEAQAAEAEYEANVAAYAQAELDRVAAEHPELRAQMEADPNKFTREFRSALDQADWDFDAAYYAYTGAAAAANVPQTLNEAFQDMAAELKAARASG